MDRESNDYKYEFDREQIKQARQADLAAYLIQKGEPLIPSGNRWRHKEHDSLVFTENAYYWNSRNETGNAIDYLVRHKDMDFKSAVYELTMTAGAGEKVIDHSIHIEHPFSLADITLNTDKRHTIAYLCKGRGINYDLVIQLISTKLIFEEIQPYNDKVTGADKDAYNVLFPIYDETGEIVGAETCGTTDKRFKGVKTGSKYGYGYWIQFGGRADNILFFESAIDLLSFITIGRNTNKSFDNCVLVSMAGLKSNIIQQMVKLNYHGRNAKMTPFLCVDNDKAGAEFIKVMTKQMAGLKTFLPELPAKDWNQQLKSMEK